MRATFVAIVTATLTLLAQGADDSWLQWTEGTTVEIGRSMRVSGRVGGFWGVRGLHTERAQNFKLRATWFTPEVLRASVRFAQLRDRRLPTAARESLRTAQQLADTVIMIELDPREGSGVIPLDWAAYLQPEGVDPTSGRSSRGTLIREARGNPAFEGVEKRDYDYDVFWLGFSLRDSDNRFLLAGATNAELVVRIHSSEGRVSWPIPLSVRGQFEGSHELRQ